jgi:DNA-directed RNA polymerase specialized sigma subunit
VVDQQKQRSSRAQRDIALWEAWKANPGKTTLTPLLKQVDPILHKEVNRWSGGPVARPVLLIQAKKTALDAFSTYDPSKAALNTHVTNQLKGLSRKPYMYASPARMPEHRQVKLKTYLNAEEDLKSTLGRVPTAAELAGHLRWSQREVGRFRQEQRATYSTSQPVPPGFESYNPEQELIDFVYHDLVDQDKLVLEHSAGYAGAPVLSAKALTKLTGMTQGQISNSKRRIRRQLENAMGYK